MASILTTVLGSDKVYDAFLTKINNLIAYRHTLDSSVKSASYTATISDALSILDASSGAITVTLPAAASSANATLYFLISNAANAVTFDGNASETINGQATLTISNKYESAILFCNGSEWFCFQTGFSQVRHSFKSVSTAYTATVADEIVLADATVGAFTVTLPTAASAKGRILHIKATSIAGGNVTIDGNGAETIDGAATLVISTANRCVSLASDGTAWYVISTG